MGLPAPVFDSTERGRIMAENDRARVKADEDFWNWYKGTLEARGKCLCPSCRVKVEKFGQYCPQCTF
jgi:hypothetical protein